MEIKNTINTKDLKEIMIFT